MIFWSFSMAKSSVPTRIRFDKAEEEEMDTAQFLDQVNEY
jgi:hypothetical protein